MKTPKIVFAGTPEFAAVSLRALLEHSEYEVVAVYTQPDRPAGRGRKLKASAVKELALAQQLPVKQPASLRAQPAQEELRALQPDFMVVAAYGLILPQAVIEIPACACLNVHASLLPRWRGAAPIQRAILAGDQETGISIMRLIEALDAGPVLTQRSCHIKPDDTSGVLHDRLAMLGAECLIFALDQILQGNIDETPQDEALATYAPKIERQERMLSWSKPAAELDRLVRALAPTPGATVQLDDQICKVLRAVATGGSGTPGEILEVSDAGIEVATGLGALCITRLQPPGKRAMSAADYARGHQLPAASDAHANDT